MDVWLLGVRVKSKAAAKLLIFHGLLLDNKPRNQPSIPHNDCLDKLGSSLS